MSEEIANTFLQFFSSQGCMCIQHSPQAPTWQFGEDAQAGSTRPTRTACTEDAEHYSLVGG